MTADIYYFIDLAKQLEHGNFEIEISGHFLKRGEWGVANRWINIALEKGSIKDTVAAKKLQQDIIGKLSG